MEIDAILYLDPSLINESYDKRTSPGIANNGYNTGPGGIVDYDDPKLYSAVNFGRQLQNYLNNMGNGYWSEVSDFGKYVSVVVGHHNPATGRSATKHFIIAFQLNGLGTLFSSATKWRTISGVGQAASYIKSITGTLSGANANKI